MIEKHIQYLFVYGTLRKGISNGTFNYINPYITLQGVAMVKGECYQYKNLPALVSGNLEQDIEGDLYKINDVEAISWVLMQLDDLKGMKPDNSDTPLYKRSVTTVTFENSNIEAWIYLFNGEIAGLPRLESHEIPNLLNI